MAYGNLEKFIAAIYFHKRVKISTTISTTLVEINSFIVNIKVTFPHFNRPYYYYYI